MGLGPAKPWDLTILRFHGFWSCTVKQHVHLFPCKMQRNSRGVVVVTRGYVVSKSLYGNWLILCIFPWSKLDPPKTPTPGFSHGLHEWSSNFPHWAEKARHKSRFLKAFRWSEDRKFDKVQISPWIQTSNKRPLFPHTWLLLRKWPKSAVTKISKSATPLRWRETKKTGGDVDNW